MHLLLILLRTSIQDALRIADYRPEIKVNCRFQIVVYAISCSRRDVFVYVGEMERQVQDRMREHLRDARLQREKPIMYHFRDTYDDRDLWFSILEKTVQCQSSGTVTLRGHVD